MVVVEYEYVEMRKLVDLPREKMIDALNNLGAPSEYEDSLGKIITEITPNRPDWYSMEGLARSLKSYEKSYICTYKAKKSNYRVIVDPLVSKVRPYTVGVVVKGLKLNDQRVRDLVLLQEKLIGTLGRNVKKFGLGFFPLQTITFPLRYTIMAPDKIKYIPLGYDTEMYAKEIITKHKKGLQYGHLLKNTNKYPVYLDSTGKIMALIPIVNSANTGKVEPITNEVYVEVTGNDFAACSAALNIIACTLADMGGDIYEVSIEYEKQSIKTPNFGEKTIGLDIVKVNKILGLKLSEKQIQKLLKRMGYICKKSKVLIPPYRADILGLVDIVEDIAIAYGYNKFTPTVPNFFHPGTASRKDERVGLVLRNMGFIEAKTFILTNKEKTTHFNDGMKMEIINPGNVDYNVVRSSLIPSMLEILSINKMKGLPQKFYEIGVVNFDGNDEKRLVLVFVDRNREFSDMRGYLQTIMHELNLNFKLRSTNIVGFDNKISAIIENNSVGFGIIGKLKDEILNKFGLDVKSGLNVFVCELALDKYNG